MIASLRHRRVRLALSAAALAAVTAAGACTTVDVPDSASGPTTSTTEPPAPPVTQQDPDCTVDNVVESLRPDPATVAALGSRDFPAGSYLAQIVANDRLRVGVDTSTQLFSVVDPQSGEFAGFDVDVARDMAEAILGNPDKAELVAIPYSERVRVLAEGEVDMVVDTFTINCVRDDSIDFSSQYFEAGQRLLVRSDDPSDGIEDFGGRPVCAAAGSTSAENMRALGDPPEVVEVVDQADCLVLLQQGRVVGISTDDTILAGMNVQDPNTKIVGATFAPEPYGIGLPPGQPDYVRFVNAVLEQMRTSGRWTELYDEWLAGPLGPAEPPPARYED